MRALCAAPDPCKLHLLFVLLVATFLGHHPHEVSGQLYTFEDAPVPKSKSLHTMSAFYVYSLEDAPDRSLGPPFIKFDGLYAKSISVTKPNDKLEDYQGVQLSIINAASWRMISPDKFCSVAADVAAGLANAPNQLLLQKPDEYVDMGIYAHTVRFGVPTNFSKDVQEPVQLTGVYILVFSNCGDFAEATVSGTVIVQNAYGFLPGNEYYRLPFYGWLSLGYACLAVTWMALSFRWWQVLIRVQSCIAGVIFFGLLESLLWWIFFSDWNSSGSRGKLLLVVATISTVLKTIFSYMSMLVASLGWGVTRPHLRQRTIRKIQAISLLYVIFGFMREAVLSFNHSHTLSFNFILYCLLPVSLLSGGIFYWIFTALSRLIKTLEERRQTDKLELFQRFWKVLVFAMGIGFLMLLCQILDLSRSSNIKWHYRWFFADGISHMPFLLVLVAMMYLCAPHANSHRYAYSPQLDGTKEECETDKLTRAQKWDADEEAVRTPIPKPTLAAENIGKNDGDVELDAQ